MLPYCCLKKSQIALDVVAFLLMSIMVTLIFICLALIAVKLLCKKPGLKDNNFQVLGHKISALGIIAKV